MKKPYLSLAILLLPFLLFSQGRGDWQGRPDGAKPPTIKGKIVDAENQQPLEFATVTLYSQKDSTMITGAISEADGFFFP